MMSIWNDFRVLITARTYPSPAKQGVEVSCTGGITSEGKWIRLFPVPYRFLTHDRRFRKYQWIDVRAAKASDSRPESYKIDIESIHIITDPLPTHDSWSARKHIVFPLKSPSLCGLQRERHETQTSLGFFKPKEIVGFDIVKEKDPDWTEAERSRLTQPDLFGLGPKQALEKIPYKFYYRFTCDDPSCQGHRLSCVDWELGQSFRQWRDKYGPTWEQKLRATYERDMSERFDTHFFVGTVRAHPDSWIIVGLFYPPIQRQEAAQALGVSSQQVSLFI